MPNPIEEDLHKVIGCALRHNKKERQQYLRRLVRMTNRSSDEKWANLQPFTQRWVNQGAEALNNKRNVPDFDYIPVVIRKVK